MSDWWAGACRARLSHPTFSGIAMKRIYGRLLIAFLFTAALSRPALAQRGFSFSRSNTLVSLAASDAVQKDLQLPQEVAGKLRALGDEYRTEAQKELAA